MHKKIILLGSGELGKEFTIAAKRLGQTVVAVDNYANAPAMQVADHVEVIDMLNGAELQRVIDKHKPDVIVPEVEAIRTEKFYEFEAAGIQVVPSAKAANFTMNRKAIRDLAAKELKLKTANYGYATTLDACIESVKKVGLPCVCKPLMSSSGKGQSIIKSETDIEHCFNYAIENSRGDIKEVIIEEFIHFHTEITLLTVTQKNAPTLFCPAIGHRQEKGDYRESWQPCFVPELQLEEAKKMAASVTKSLGGAGIWGVEFFLSDTEVYFSELSPRPHDTGMVTLAGTQNLNEFELHARAVLGLPIPEITLERSGASAVILATKTNTHFPEFTGIENALVEKRTDIRIFGKPATRPNRRMGVALVHDTLDASMVDVIQKAIRIASLVKVD